MTEHMTEHTTTASEDDPQCMGMYMTMFMDGFHWTSTACLSFFVRSWKLAQSDGGACLFSCLLAILMESLTAARNFLLHRQSDRYGLYMALYLAQAVLGYLLMLIAMTFSVPLVLSMVVGLMVGNHFLSPSRRLEQTAIPRRPANDLPSPENSSSLGSLTLRRRG